MLLIAATALDKIKAVPADFWLKLGLGIIIVIAAVFLIRKAAGMNKVLLTVIILVVVSAVGFHWIYSRNEPRFLTPLIDKIAPFFPSANPQKADESRRLQP